MPLSVVPGSDFRDLAAYRIAAELSDELYGVVGRWRALDQWTMGIQMIRSADSIGANIAEASGRLTVPERRRFLLIARGSLHELEHWMTRADARGVLTADIARLEELARTVNGLVRRHRQT